MLLKRKVDRWQVAGGRWERTPATFNCQLLTVGPMWLAGEGQEPGLRTDKTKAHTHFCGIVLFDL